MEYKALKAVNEISEGGIVTGIANTTGVLDLGNDIVHAGSFKKTIKEGFGKVKHLWSHDYNNPPIAVITELKEVGRNDLPEAIRDEFPNATGGLSVTRKYLDTPKAQEVLAGLAGGAITEMSIGFDPVKFDFEELDQDQFLVRNIRELRLYDTSDVLWGMNQATAAVKVAYRPMGISKETWVEPTASVFIPEGSSFEKEWDRVVSHFTHATGTNFSDLHLPHHKPVTKGVGPVVLDGLIQAMLGLVSEWGDIPTMQASYNHLASHYKEFELVPPSFESIILCASALRILEDPEKLTGHGVTSDNMDRLSNSLKTITQILGQPMPQSQSDLEQEIVLTALLMGRLKNLSVQTL